MKIETKKLSPVSICATAAMISFVLFILSFSDYADAITMRNDRYKIQGGNFNSFAGKSTGASGTITTTGGQNAIGLFAGTNYKVRSGFQYIYSVIPFTFSISTITINFGGLNPGEPITRTNTLTISNGSAYGYQVTASENNSLRVLSTGVDIPDTTCDAGTCTETTSAAWTSPLTYGFGYRCDDLAGTDCSTDFSTSTFYKQFANIEKGESPQIIMSGANVGRNKQVQVTYKVNVSGTQPSGGYQNIIQYIATPSI